MVFTDPLARHNLRPLARLVAEVERHCSGGEGADEGVGAGRDGEEVLQQKLARWVQAAQRRLEAEGSKKDSTASAATSLAGTAAVSDEPEGGAGGGSPMCAVL